MEVNQSQKNIKFNSVPKCEIKHAPQFQSIIINVAMLIL